MPWRKWLVRGLVFSLVALSAGAALLYQRFTNPAAARQQVFEQLGKEFIGARISLDAARFRLFGGIHVADLRMCRRDDLDKADFLSIPEAVIHLDKEQLLDGKPVVRKIELHRPRLRLVRERDGRWNLVGILGPVDLSRRLPTLVIQHGTALVEDRGAEPGTPPLEIKDLNLTLVNDPLPVVTFEGGGNADLAGPVRLSGRWHRGTGETDLTLDAPAIAIGPALVQRLSAWCADAARHARQLEGTLEAHAQLSYHPDAPEPWGRDIQLHLTNGKLRHARLPLPLEQLDADVRYVNGLIPLCKITARSGPAAFHLTLKDLAPCCGDACLSTNELKYLDLKIDHLPVTHDILAALPDDLGKEIEADYSPTGLVSVDYTLRRDRPGDFRKHCLIKAEELSGQFHLFRYPLHKVAGTLDYEATATGGDRLQLDLVGLAESRPVTIRGAVRHPPAEPGQPKPHSIVAVDIWGDNIPLDETLLTALRSIDGEGKHEKLARSFNATGVGDFHAYIRHDGIGPRFDNRYLVQFHDCTFRYKAFPYLLEKVAATLDIHQGQGWEFRDFRGFHKGGEFRASGRSLPGERAEVRIGGTNVLLDDELKQALLKERLLRTWDEFSPAGRIDFAGKIEVPPGPMEEIEPEIDLTVYARGCSIRPDFFRYPMEVLRGKVRYAKKWVQLEDLVARHGDSVLGLKEGWVYLKPAGGLWARLVDLHGAPLLMDAAFLDALPESLRKVCAALELKDPVALNTTLVIDSSAEAGRPPVIYWDGGLRLRDATLQAGIELEKVTGEVACRGLHDGKQVVGLVGNIMLDSATVLKQPLRGLYGQMEITKGEPDVLKFPGLRAGLFGGEVYGPVRVEFGPPLRYDVRLTASRIRLEEFGRHNFAKSEMSGLASAEVYLTGKGADLDNLKGSGRIDVPSGKMANLPLLLDLLKFLALRVPDRTAFDEAHAEFDINGHRARVRKLDLYGNAISLRGQGDLSLDGSELNLDFNADWARLTQLLPPGVRQVPPAISDQLLRIKMRGKASEPRFEKDLVPLVTDPVKRLFGDPPPRPVSMGMMER